ncbi:protein FAM3C [Eucyclogobius newberryi]|uniref:protein FAM3C n=1 Tax=Eucyclogobius newberryi TaxID=166745 RepID=UPI003B59B27C
MRSRAVVQLVSLVISVILVTWIITNNTLNVQKTARDLWGMDYSEPEASATQRETIKCNLERDCEPGAFAVRLKSGAANVVGPTICFDGQKLMSPIRDNVGAGLNIVVVDGNNGSVDDVSFLNSKDGRSADILAHLTKIKLGRIVLLASFNDVTPKMTDEIMDVLESMGSTLIKTLKSKDNWVFAGRTGANRKSQFEKISVNDPATNPYGDWPEVVEISGCVPKNSL